MDSHEFDSSKGDGGFLVEWGVRLMLWVLAALAASQRMWWLVALVVMVQCVQLIRWPHLVQLNLVFPVVRLLSDETHYHVGIGYVGTSLHPVCLTRYLVVRGLAAMLRLLAWREDDEEPGDDPS